MENTQIKTAVIEGTYKVKVHTPMGVEDGTLILKVDGNELSGNLENSKGSAEFTGGTIKGGDVEFTTKIKTPMGRLKSHVKAKIDGNNFNGIAKLPLGSAKIEGKKVEQSERSGE